MSGYVFSKPKPGNVGFDWSNGDRWWGPDHVHHKLPDEPISYTGWHEWAKARGRKHKQVSCSTPGCPILRWTDDPAVEAQ